MPESHTSADWICLYREVIGSPGIILLLGAPDTGKSTLAHFLVHKSMQEGLKTSYVDGDLGQSILGPPTTLGMASPSSPPAALSELGCDRLYFIGATSPAGHLLATAAGVKKLVESAKQDGAEMVVVDTTGLVAGEMGFELKFYKMELLGPRHIIAIQKGDEVEHILKGFGDRKGIRIHRLSPNQGVCPRSPEVRRAYRERRFQEYFEHCTRRTIALDAVKFIHPALPLICREGIDESFKGKLLGLNDEEYFTLGLGIWEGFDQGSNEASILTPLEDLGGIKYLHLGHVSLTIST